MNFLKIIIPTSIKIFIKFIYYSFKKILYNNNNNEIVKNYLIFRNEYFKNENIRKIIKIKFFDKIFYIPRTAHNARIIQRTEKERIEIEQIHQLFSQPSTYIDIGANIGYWTFSRNFILQSNIKFFCFEPSHLNFMYLNKNLNQYKNIKIVNCGLSNKSEKRQLSFPHWEQRKFRQSNTGLLSLYGNTNIHSENVELITLDSYFSNHKVGKSVYIRIDAEGHELQILKGSQQFLKQDIDIIVQLEFNFMIENVLDNNNINEISKLFTNLNYKPNIIKNDNIELLQENELKDIIDKKRSIEIYFRK